MKKFLTLGIILIHTYSIAQTSLLSKDSFPTEAEKVSFYYELAKKYNSDATAVLKSDQENTYLFYADGAERRQLLKDYNTVIHETVHGINSTFSDRAEYFIGTGLLIGGPPTDIYLSSELNNFVPVEQQQKIFRYETYIAGRDEYADLLSSIQDGIYGIMGEYVAFYHGTKVSQELFAYYSTLNDQDSWIDYLQDINGTMTSYYEFRLFIAWYIQYAKSNHNQIYNEIMKDKSLRVTFTLIDGKFTELIRERELLDERVIAEINKLGGKTELVDGNIIISSTGKSSLSSIDPELLKQMSEEQKKLFETAVFSSEMSEIYQGWEKQTTYLKSLFTKEVTTTLKDFAIQGVSTENYTSYLK